ncbi:unnamed protein product, partial [Rotaria magnacalcarata]
KLCGRVQNQVRAFERHSSDNVHNRSHTQSVTRRLSSQEINEVNKSPFTIGLMHTPEQRII